MINSVSPCLANSVYFLMSFSVPPHGQGLDGDLETIFEIEHLKNCRIFLNVQCTHFLMLISYG